MPRPLRSFEPGGFYHLTAREFSRAVQYLNSAHARRFNLRHDRTGHLFRARFRATVLEDERHLEAACAYVLLNPVRAGLSAHPEEWRWAGAVGSAA